MARVKWQHVAQESDGDTRANKTVTMTKADGTALGFDLYSAVSGGSPLVSLTTNSLGLFEVYADLATASAIRTKITVDGDSSATNSEPQFDPADLFYTGMAADRTLGGALAVSGALTVSGLVTGTAGLTVTRNADSYAGSFQNTHSNGKGLVVLDADGNNALAVRRVSGKDVVGINAPDAFITDASTLQVLGTHSASHVQIDSQMESTGTAGTDSGAIRGVAQQLSGSTALRALEAQTIRPTGTGPNDTWGIEVGLHSEVAGTNPGMNVGIKILSEDWPSITAVRANTGVLIGGSRGFDDGIRVYDTNGSDVLFRTVSLTSGSDVAGDVVAFNRVRAGAGSVSLPSLTFDGDLNTGWSGGGDAMVASTGGTRRLTLDAGGNVVIGAGIIATNATDGFLYITAMGGVPSGVPTTQTGRVAMVYDGNANALYIYSGAWRSVAVT